MLLYHRTSAAGADVILRSGFKDATGAYVMGREWSGVWVSDRPLDESEGGAQPSSARRAAQHHGSGARGLRMGRGRQGVSGIASACCTAKRQGLSRAR
jgi:hypothetical protein